MGLESTMSVMLMCTGLKYLDHLLIKMIFHTQRFLDSIFCFIFICGLFSLSNKRVHAFVCSQEPVHEYNCFERKDALHEGHDVREAGGADHGLVREDGLQWPASHSNQASEEAKKARFLS